MLYQFIKAEVDRAENQIDHHDQGHALDGLSGLVDRGAGHGNEIGVADGHRQGAVFGQVQHLAGEGRDNDPQGLGQNDQIQDLAGFQTDGHGGFRLALADGLNPGPHDLGHKGCRVKHKPQQQGREFGAHADAAFKIEAFQVRHIHGGGGPGQPPGDERQTDQDGRRNADQGEDLPRTILALAGPAANQVDRNAARQEGDGHIWIGGVGCRNTEDQPPVADENTAKQIEACRGPGSIS